MELSMMRHNGCVILSLQAKNLVPDEPTPHDEILRASE
jgi:hypothetical protein